MRNRWTAASLLAVVLGLWGLAAPAWADDKVVRIGVMNDMSGPYKDLQGPGSVVAARPAVADQGGKAAGLPVEIIAADHQNKPDVGATLAREWFDTRGADAVADLPNSAVAFAVNQVIGEKNKVLLGSGVGTDVLTGAQCSANAVQWAYDTDEAGHALAQGLLQRGGKTWYFITAGYALQDQASAQVVAEGGQELGAAGFASFVVGGAADGRKVVGR